MEKQGKAGLGLRWMVGLVVVVAMLTTVDALALEGTFGEHGAISVDTQLSYTSSWRVEGKDDDFLAPGFGHSQGDDNFENGGQVESFFKALIDADVNWKGDHGVFLRAVGFYDTVYSDRKSKFSSTLNPAAGDYYTNDYDDFEDVHGNNVDLLDAYAYTNFRLAGMPVDLRAGQQTIFWGESLLIFGSVASSMNPLDTTLSNTPGYETKEVLMPTGRLYGAISTPDDKLTLAVSYKYEWDKSKVSEAGHYWATSDALDGSVSNLLGIPRAADVGEKDGDEYALALRYLFDNGDEVGLYYVNYRDHLPQLKLGAAGYYLEYEDDIDLYAASYSTVIPATNTNVAAEIGYRPSVMVGGVGTGQYIDAEVLQIQANAIQLFGDVPGADAATGYFAAAYNTVLDRERSELGKDKDAFGVRAKVIFDYFNVMDGLDMKVPVSVSWNPYNKTSFGISGLSEGSHSYAVGLEGIYLGNYRASLTYTGYLGNTDDNSKTDRDFVTFQVKYTF